MNYFYHYSYTDSITNTENQYYSKSIYDKKGKLIYDTNIDLWDSNCSYFKSLKENNVLDGKICGNDTVTATRYIHDDKKGLYYIISGIDTQFVYKFEKKNGKILTETCIKGCTYTNTYLYDGDLLVKSITIFDSTQSMNVFKYDTKKRPIFSAFWLRKESDTIYSYIKTTYNDSLNTKEEYSSNTATPNSYSKIYYTLNEKGLPTSMETEAVDEGILRGRLKVKYHLSK